MWIIYLADISHEMSRLIFYEIYKQEGHDGPVTLTWAT